MPTAPRDWRTLTDQEIRPLTFQVVAAMRGARFKWTKWELVREEWDHDHCEFCWACICDHRERSRQGGREFYKINHFRHAYLSVDDKGHETWVCRSCFKRLRELGEWKVIPGTESPEDPLKHSPSL